MAKKKGMNAGMKRILSVFLIFVMLSSLYTFAEDMSENDYVADEVLFEFDFESCETGTPPSSEGNVYFVGTPEWTRVPDTGGGTVEADAEGNKFYRFFNNTKSNLSANIGKYFNFSTQSMNVFEAEFDIRTMGAGFQARFYDMVGAYTTMFLDLARGSNMVFGQKISPTQWTNIRAVVDNNKNMMQIYVNGILALEDVFQTKYNKGKTTCGLNFYAILSPGEEAFIDNVKVTRLKPTYNAEDIKPVIIDQEEFEYVPSENGIPEFASSEEVLGAASFSLQSTRATSGMTKVGHRTYVTFVGSPAYIYEYDTLTGKYINRIPLGSGQFFSFQVGSNGKLYSAPNGLPTIYEYDPETQVNKEIVRYIPDRSGQVWHMNLGANGNADTLYMAHYFGSYLERGCPAAEFNVKTGEAKVYEGVTENLLYKDDPANQPQWLKYSHAATGNDKYIFAGYAESGHPERIVRIDKETGEKLYWENTDRDFAAGSVFQTTIVGDKLFTRIRNISFCIDINTMKEVARFESGTRGGRQTVSYPKPEGDENIIYYLGPDEQTLMEFDLNTGKTKQNVKFENPKAGLGIYHFSHWVQKADGEWAIVAVLNHELVAHITPGNPKIDYYELEIPKGLLGAAVEALNYYVSRDDILYTGGYESGLNGFDLKTNEAFFSVKNEIQHGMTMVNGMLIGGTYAYGKFFVYDPTRPADMETEKNPYHFYTAPSTVIRFYNSKDTNAGFGLLAGITDYGGEHGALMVVTYADGEPKALAYRGIIPNENVVGVEYKDGYFYVSSTVYVASREHHKEAHLIKADARTGEVVASKTYKFDGLSDVKRIGELAFGPDGLLYAAVSSGTTIMAVNPEDLSLVKYKTLYPLREEDYDTYSFKMMFGADGILYSTVGNQIHATNIETMESEVLWPTSDRMIIDNDGNVIKKYGSASTGTDMSAVKVNQRQRLDIMISNAEKYYKEDDFSRYSWKVYQRALAEAKLIDLSKSSDEEVKSAARKLTFAIKDLKTKYDEDAGFAFPFGENLSAFNDMIGYEPEVLEAVNALKEYRIINGVDGKNFFPEKSITRAEFVKILSVIEGYEDSNIEEAHEFSDVSKDSWYYGYVQNAYKNGWVLGVSETEFKPNDVITEEEMILVLNRLKENAFEKGEPKEATRKDAAVLLYKYIKL